MWNLFVSLSKTSSRNIRRPFHGVRAASSGAPTSSGKPHLLTIGIPQETYNTWERRAPLTPSQVQELISEANGRLSFVVQPSSRRVFSDSEYARAGADISNDLSSSEVIMGVKRPESVLRDKTYFFFSHTIKGQPENMALLQECLDKKVQLFDYERITKKDANGKQVRLVSFGRYAGIAGTIDTLHGFGRKMLAEGVSTPFLSFPPAILHNTVDEAKQNVLRLGERIASEGVQQSEPLVFAVTGKGGCVHGGCDRVGPSSNFQ
jgi:alpha-aminoadipic semialdehyde synthase